MTTQTHLTEVAFTTLDLQPGLQQALAEAGFQYCTPVQAHTLPLVLAGQDAAAQAQTGTGKTAAFLLTIFDHLSRHPAAAKRKPQQPRALVVAPTRELAIQIHKDALLLGKHMPFRLGLVYGGTGYEQQRNTLNEGVDVLIGTPGRLIDYFKQRIYDLRELQVAVLDEADRMFDLGFISDVRFLFRRMPPPEARLSMLFSATLSLRVSELAYEHMNNPRAIDLNPDKRTADRVEQSVYHPATDEKTRLLVGLLRDLKPQRAMVFVNTKYRALRLEATLVANGVEAGLLSGDVPQRKRQRLLESFRDGKLAVLIATDVAARGLHIDDVSHVFNFDLPQQAEDYVHRIGRTARAGQAGAAISFACEEYAFSLPEIESFLGHKLPTAAIDEELLPELQQGKPLTRRNDRSRRDNRNERPRRDNRKRRSRRPPRQAAAPPPE